VNVAARISGAARKGLLKFKGSSSESNTSDSKLRQFFARARRRNSEAVLPSSVPPAVASRHAAHALSSGALPIPTDRIRDTDEESTSSVGTSTTNTNSEVRASSNVRDSRVSDFSSLDIEHINSHFTEDDDDEAAVRLTDITEEQSEVAAQHQLQGAKPAGGACEKKPTSSAGLARKESMRLFRQRSRFEKFSNRCVWTGDNFYSLDIVKATADMLLEHQHTGRRLERTATLSTRKWCTARGSPSTRTRILTVSTAPGCRTSPTCL
jgi:hypothetical protein